MSIVDIFIDIWLSPCSEEVALYWQSALPFLCTIDGNYGFSIFFFLETITLDGAQLLAALLDSLMNSGFFILASFNFSSLVL